MSLKVRPAVDSDRAVLRFLGAPTADVSGTYDVLLEHFQDEKIAHEGTSALW